MPSTTLDFQPETDSLDFKPESESIAFKPESDSLDFQEELTPPSLQSSALPPGARRDLPQSLNKTLLEVQPNYQRDLVEKSRKNFLQAWEEDVAQNGPTNIQVEEPTFLQAIHRPLVRFPRMEPPKVAGRPQAEADIATGAVNAASAFAEFFTSPVGIATFGLGSVPMKTRQLVSGYFAASMAKQMPELANQFAEAWEAGDTAKATENALNGALNMLFITGAAKHALERAPNPSAEIGKRIGETFNRTIQQTEFVGSLDKAAIEAMNPERAQFRAPELPKPEIPPIVRNLEKDAPMTAEVTAKEIESVRSEIKAATEEIDPVIEATKKEVEALRKEIDNVTTASVDELTRTEPTPVKAPPEEALAATGKTETVGEAPATGEQPPAPLTEKAAAETVKPEPKIEGMGAAIPEEFNAPNSVVSNMFAAIDRDRALNGQEPMPATKRRTWDEDNNKALAKMNRDPEWIPRLLAEVEASPRPLLSWENAGLVWHRAKLRAEANNALRRVAQSFEDGRMEDLRAAQADTAYYENELQRLDETVGRNGTGSEAGRSLQAQKMGAGEDFSLVEMRLRKRASANDGGPLTPIQEAEVKVLHDKIVETQKAFDDYVAETNKRESERALKEAIAETERKAKAEPAVEPHVRLIADKVKQYFDARAQAALKRLQSGTWTISPQVLADLTDLGVSKILSGAIEFGQWSAKMAADLGERVKPHLRTIWDTSQNALDEHVKKLAGPKSEKVKRAATGTETKDQISDVTGKIKTRLDEGRKSEITVLVQKLARLFVEEGVREREPLIDAVHGVLEGIDPAWTRRDTMDAISGYGSFKQLSQDEISVKLRDLKGQMQQVAKLEDMAKGQAPQKTGVERRSPTDEERRLIQQVNEAKKKGGFVVTDPAKQLASALDARKTYYRNRISDLKQEIATREKIVRSKTPPPTDPVLDAMKAEYDQLRKDRAAIFGESKLSPEQRLKMALAAVERDAAEYQRKIEAGEFSGGKKPSSVVETPELKAARARRDVLREQFQELRDLNEEYQRQQSESKLQQEKKVLEESIKSKEKKIASGDVSTTKTPVNRPADPLLEPLKQRRDALNKQLAELRKKPEEQKAAEALERKVQDLNKRIAAKEAQIASGDLSTQAPKVNRPLPPELEQAKQRLEQLNKQLAELRHPKKSPEERALQSLKTRLATQIETFQRKLNESDFTRKVKKVTPRDAEADRLHFEMTKAKTEWHKAMIEDMMKRQNIGEKMVRWTGEVLNTSRAIMTSFDLSAVLRQGGFVSFVHPIRALKAFPDMLQAYRSEAGQHAAHLAILRRKNFPLYAQAKLFIAEHGHKLSQMEEAYMSRWADKIPIVAGSQRAYITFLNRIRADSFDALHGSLARGKELTPRELNAIANFVNVATGRGNIGMKENSLVGLNHLFFAPRLVASRFQLLLGQPLYRGTARTRVMILNEYAKFFTSAALIYGMAKMMGAEINEDPKSSDFGKIKIGNTRIDIMAGLQQITVLLSRVWTGETTTPQGKTVVNRGPDKKFGTPSTWDVMGKFARTKFAPLPSAVVNLATGSDVIGNPVTPESAALSMITPLSLRDILTTMEDQGVPRGTAISVLSIFGAGVQTYDENIPAKYR